MRWLVEKALAVPFLVVALAAGLLGVGLWCWSRMDIEAYPNPVAPMIEVITQPSGWSAEEVERYVTIPLENGLAGMIDLDHIRSQSLFGLSDVKCYFTWTPDYHTAQQRVLNRLQFIQLPPGVQPQLSPWNPIGEIFRYTVVGEGYSLAELKTAEDFILERQFRQVPGVVDVVGFGGETKQYQVEVDPYRLKGQGLTLAMLTQAIGNANQNVGGQRLSLGEQSFNVRGLGLIRSLDDIGQIVLAQPKAGTPVRVRDVARVREGAAPRLGVVGKDAEPDVVQGIVLMRYGGSSLQTLQGVHERVELIRKNHLLPIGMDLQPYYDRERLVTLTTHTVMENLIVGMALVTLVLWIFLGQARAAAVAAVNIPLALMAAFCGMVFTGTPANLISLGAVDFGIIVDSTVIMVENIYRHLGPRGRGSLRGRIADAAAEIGGPMLFSTLIITLAFVPLFTMTGVAGVIFSPMAHTYAFAIGGAVVLSVALTPVLAAWLLRVDTRSEHREGHEEPHGHDNRFLRWVDRVYRPVFSLALRRPWTAVGLALAPLALAAALLPAIGTEFMPKLEEGNFWIRATLPTSVSLETSAKHVGRMRRIILGCEDETCARRRNPEIRTVVSQLGRPDDGTDVSGFYNIEMFAPLLPQGEWRRGITKDKLTDQLSRELREAFPGVDFNFSQAIADNVEEAMSGVKGENTVKVIGPDLKVNEQKAGEVVASLQQVRGIEDLGMFRSLGQPDLKIVPDRERCGRYGLNVGDVGAIVQAAIGGQAVTQVYEGEKKFDLVVRWAEPYRKDLRAIRQILVPAPDGSQIPLGQLAAITEEDGPSVIYREDNRRYTPVKFSVRGRDLGSTIAEARDRVDSDIKLPYDTHLEWAGEADQMREAAGRLSIVIPLTLVLIAFLVYSAVGGARDMLVVLLSIPVACTGGVIALFVTRTHLSISAAMGFVSIFGIAVQDAIIVVTYARRMWGEGHSLAEGAQLAAERGLRPALMTASVALIGLLPAAVSRGIGSETQKPLAIVVIGGMLVLAVLPRLLLPALLTIAHAPRAVPSRAAAPG
ncbi:MAG TPA: CusA/CzcA family heavy metal efflux RND transporter [Myxococcales bacterium]|nr:CusA/CzcA family heavy metal efflux RND transporter [Myxococcales bacterium]